MLQILKEEIISTVTLGIGDLIPGILIWKRYQDFQKISK